MIDRQVVTFELQCIDLPRMVPPGFRELRLGLQEKPDVQQDIPCIVKQARFKFSAEVVLDPTNDGVHFSSRYIYGPRGHQCIYLCWGERSSRVWKMYRRAKVPLSGLSRRTVEAAVRNRQPIRARIRMTNYQGEPAAALLRPEYVKWIE